MAGSYAVVGNNGTHAMGGTIMTGVGAPSAVLTSLAAFSDHLPVIADYAFAVPEPGAILAILVGIPTLTLRRRR